MRTSIVVLVSVLACGVARADHSVPPSGQVSVEGAVGTAYVTITGEAAHELFNWIKLESKREPDKGEPLRVVGKAISCTRTPAKGQDVFECRLAVTHDGGVHG